jgi:hypothetical protein
MYYELYKIYKAMNLKPTKKNTIYIYKEHFFDEKIIEYARKSINKSIKNIEMNQSKKTNNNKLQLNNMIINANERDENEKKVKTVILGLSALSFSAYLVYYFIKR